MSIISLPSPYIYSQILVFHGSEDISSLTISLHEREREREREAEGEEEEHPWVWFGVYCFGH